jgi:hypothetical protein
VIPGILAGADARAPAALAAREPPVTGAPPLGWYIAWLNCCPAAGIPATANAENASPPGTTAGSRPDH